MLHEESLSESHSAHQCIKLSEKNFSNETFTLCLNFKYGLQSWSAEGLNFFLVGLW